MKFFIYVTLFCFLCLSCTKPSPLKDKKEKIETLFTDEELSFALQLTPQNRDLFLQKFSAIERAKTIYFFSTHPKTKTANEVVEQSLKK